MSPMRRGRLRELSPGAVAIFAGGTGLYFKALMTGLAAIPPVDPAIRAALRARLEAEGVEALHAELGARDPVAAGRIMPRDRSRILRALEVLEATGRPISDWHREGLPPAIDPDRVIKIFLHPERGELKRRIEGRFEAMLTQGALEEVRALDARRLPETLPAMKAHGVPWLRRHFRGEIIAGTGGRGGDHGHPPLCQAAGHLVPKPDAGLGLDPPGGGGGGNPGFPSNMNRQPSGNHQ